MMDLPGLLVHFSYARKDPYFASFLGFRLKRLTNLWSRME